MGIISAMLSSLADEPTAHRQGSKKVFLRNSDTPTNLTQAAYGTFGADDFCERHSHATMEEVFFFLSGQGTYTVGDQRILLEKGVFVRVPAGVSHRLEVVGDEPLHYVYFSIATE